MTRKMQQMSKRLAYPPPVSTRLPLLRLKIRYGTLFSSLSTIKT